MAAAKIKMTVIALRGCPCASTCPIHPDKGSTPSRATANTKRDEATIATVVFYREKRVSGNANYKILSHHYETKDSYNRHENTSFLAQSESINLDEWLWGVKSKYCVEVWRAEQKQDGGNETKHSCCDGTR
jgi:hypothetical protein